MPYVTNPNLARNCSLKPISECVPMAPAGRAAKFMSTPQSLDETSTLLKPSSDAKATVVRHHVLRLPITSACLGGETGA